MNLVRQFKKILPGIADKIIGNIKKQINMGLFNNPPWGAPLAQETLKRRNGSTALSDTGMFKNGLNKNINGTTVSVFSNGRTEKQQQGFVLGNAKGVPARNPFVEDLPTSGGSNIGDLVEKEVGNNFETYINNEISKIPGVT